MRNVIADPETGISQLFTNIMEPIARNVPFLVLLLIGLFWVCLQTQFMSNMCSMVLVYTVMVPIAAATGTGNPIALGFVINTLARQANTLPSGTVNTAIVIGTGWVPVPFMARYGAIMIMPMVLIWAFVCYPWASFIFR
jgi:sodium-dependent dicarboxylate transporter 2/3/5